MFSLLLSPSTCRGSTVVTIELSVKRTSVLEPGGDERLREFKFGVNLIKVSCRLSLVLAIELIPSEDLNLLSQRSHFSFLGIRRIGRGGRSGGGRGRVTIRVRTRLIFGGGGGGVVVLWLRGTDHLIRH